MPNKNTIIDLDVNENRAFAAMSYLWILCLIPLLLKRKSDYVQFHAKQGLVLFLIELVLGIVMWVPFFGQVLFVLCTVIAVIGVIKAYNGERWQIPFIYDWSTKIKL